MTSEILLRRSICEIGRLLYERKLIVATDGNISARLDRQHILITPAGVCKGLLTEDGIVRLSLGAHASVHGSSTETPMHLAAYGARPDISAVIHAHPPYATSFAVSGWKLDAKLLPETTLFDGPVGRVPFVKPGSDKLAAAAARVLGKHNYALLTRHGAIAVGRNLLEAYYRLERLEFLAQETHLAKTQVRMPKSE